MKGMKIFLAVLFLTCVTRASLAHPPSEIELSYDEQKQTLSISMTHMTRDMKEHYIRRIEVSVNGKETADENYKKQQTPVQFTAEISLEAQPGDIIAVKVYSAKGGSKEASLEVPKEETEEEKPWARRRYDKQDIEDDGAPLPYQNRKKEEHKGSGYYR